MDDFAGIAFLVLLFGLAAFGVTQIKSCTMNDSRIAAETEQLKINRGYRWVPPVTQDGYWTRDTTWTVEASGL